MATTKECVMLTFVDVYFAFLSRIVSYLQRSMKGVQFKKVNPKKNLGMYKRAYVVTSYIST